MRRRLAAIAAGLLAAVLLAAVSVRGLRLAAERQFAQRLGPLVPTGYSRPAPKSEENAARYFLAACNRLNLSGEELQFLAGCDPSADQLDPRLLRLVAKNEAALRLAWQGALLPESFYGLDYGEGFQAELPDLPKLVSLGKLLYLQARRDGGEPGGGVLPLQALGTLADSLQGEPGLSPFSAGLSLERWQLWALAQLLRTGPRSVSQVQALMRSLSRVDLPSQFPRVVGLEEASLRLALGPPRNAWSFLAEDWGRFRSARSALALARLAEVPTSQWKEKLRQEEDTYRFRLLATLAQAQGVQASRLAGYAALAVVSHRAQHGKLPAGLAVVPAALRPNPFTGQALALQPQPAAVTVPDGETLWHELALATPPPPFTLALPGG